MPRRSRPWRSTAVLLGGLVVGAAASTDAAKPAPLALYPGADPQPKTEHVFSYPMPEALAAARAVLKEASFEVFAVPGSQSELYTAWKLGNQLGGGHGQVTLKQGVRVQAVSVSPNETVVRFFRLTRTEDAAVMAYAPRRIDPGSRFTEGARPPSDLEHFNDQSEIRYEKEERLATLRDETFSYGGATWLAAKEGRPGPTVPGNAAGEISAPGLAGVSGAGGVTWATKMSRAPIVGNELQETLGQDARFENQRRMPTGDDLRGRNERGLRDRGFEKALVRRLEQFPSLEFTGGAYDVAAAHAPAGAPSLAEAYAREGGERPFSKAEKGEVCGQPISGLMSFAAPGATLLVGEQAGTREVPAAVGNMACQLASQQRSVLLALSIPRDEQGALDAYMASAGRREDEDALLARDFWRLAPRDGHSSRAMLVLLERVRAWRASGLAIKPIAMDARDLRDNRRERAIAELLLKQRRAAPGAVLLVLAGNYHVRVEPGAEWSSSFEPFGLRLAKAGVQQLSSFDTAFARGRRWTCALNVRSEPECRVYAAAPTEESYSPPGLAPAIARFESDAAPANGFHGVLHVGALTPSLPAVPTGELRAAARLASAGPDESVSPPMAVAIPAAGVAPRSIDAAETGPVHEEEEGEEAPAPVTAALDPRRKAEDCGEAVFGADALYKAGGLLLLGELQGSQEAPALVSQLVCHAASRKLSVTLALEMARSEQKRINRFLSSAGGADELRRLLNGAFWNRPYQDGRSSRAMLQLLERVRQQRSSGLPVEVLAYDTPAQGTQHDALMAQALLAERARQPGRLMVVLTGNHHARSVRGAEWDKDYLPLGLLLRQREPQLVALDMDHGGGGAWSCKLAPGGQVQCGAFNEAANLDMRRRFLSGASVERPYLGARPFVQLGKERSPEGFDGLYYVGALTPAEPANAPKPAVR